MVFSILIKSSLLIKAGLAVVVDGPADIKGMGEVCIAEPVIQGDQGPGFCGIDVDAPSVFVAATEAG